MSTAGPAPTVAVCTVAIGVGAALGFVPGFVATELQADLGISRTQLGLIVSLYFGATGAASIIGGRFADRFGARKVVTADLLVVAACAAAAAISGRYLVVLLTSLVAGTGYAWANAGTNLAIAKRVPFTSFPPKRWGMTSWKSWKGGAPRLPRKASLPTRSTPRPMMVTPHRVYVHASAKKRG